MNKYRISSLLLALCTLGGCAGQTAFDYHDASEIPQGPGMFTDGKATLSFKGDAKTPYRGNVGPTEFLQWKEAFEQASEHRKYEMWLELQSK